MFPLLVGLAGAAPDLGPTLDRDEAVQLALSRNPHLSAADVDAASGEASVRAISRLDAPMLELSVAPMSLFGGHHPPGGEVTFTQPLRPPGMASADRDTARAEAEVRQADRDVERHAVALRAVEAWGMLWTAERALELLDAHQALVDELLAAARARYATGDGTLDDPLTAEIEQLELADARLRIAAEARIARAELAGLLALPAASLPPTPAELPDPVVPPEGTFDRPEQAAASAMVQANASMRDGARRARVPMSSVMAGYNSMWEASTHRLMVGVGFALPVDWGARAAEVDVAEARLAAAHHHAAALDEELVAERTAAEARWDEASARLPLARQRLELAQQRLAVAREAYTAGSGRFESLVMAARGQTDAELGLIRARAALDLRAAERARANGALPGGVL